MSFKKIVILTFILSLSIAQGFQARSLRAQLQRHAITFLACAMPNPRRIESSTRQWIRPKFTTPRLAMLQIPRFQFTCIDFSKLRPQKTIEQEDQEAAQLIDKLMDGKEKIHRVQEQFKEFSALKCQHPELYEKVKNYEHSPLNLKKFTQELKDLSLAGKLPPQFKQAFDKQEKKLDDMYYESRWNYYCYTAGLYKEIS